MFARSTFPLILLAALGSSCRSTALRNEVANDGTPVRVEIAEEEQPAVSDPEVSQRLNTYREEQAKAPPVETNEADDEPAGEPPHKDEEEPSVGPGAISERIASYVEQRGPRFEVWESDTEEDASAPFSFDPFVERNCPPEGSALGAHNQDQNRLKNRVAKTSAADIDSAVTLDAMRALSADDSGRWSTGRAATIVGYVRTAKATGAETCNCKANIVRLKDTHLDIVSGPNDNDLPVIAEITPVWRLIREHKHLGSWASADIRSKYEGHMVRITGWLFFDDIHKTGARNSDPNDTAGEDNWRATCWEIHPITKIELIPEP